MSGTIVVDRIESDASYASSINIASPLVVANTVSFSQPVTVSNTFVVPAGTVSAPAITPTGDTNTGIFFPAADNIGFATNGVIRGRWTTDGLCFGTDTAAANALDDYEEGTWTPTLGGAATAGTFVYLFQVGTYTKIGNTVTVAFTIVITSVTVAAAGPITVFNMPFTASASSVYRAGGSIANIQGMQLNGTAPLIEIGDSATTLTVYGFNNNAAFGASDASTIGAGDFINGSLTYFV